MVFDKPEPHPLLLRESGPAVLLLRHPVREPLLDVFGERYELLVPVKREPHERHDIGEEPGPAGPFHLGSVKGLIGMPEQLGGPRPRRSLDGLREGLDVLEPQPPGKRHAIEHLESGDLVLVLPDERLERRDEPAGLLTSGGRVARLEDDVLAYRVEGLLEALLQEDQLLAQVRVRDQRRQRLLEELLLRLLDERGRRRLPGRQAPERPRGVRLSIRVERRDDARDEL